MARGSYDFSKENREIICDINKNERGDVVRVSKITNDKDEVFYDIRNMFVGETGELQYTAKGVRLSDEQMLKIMIALNKHFDDMKE
ncbi:MAG: hypothetical protein IJ593_04765 [Lachnospiraceae bacterium]|nr:hypothetical protein [Lachnospiraceae bacterium]